MCIDVARLCHVFVCRCVYVHVRARVDCERNFTVFAGIFGHVPYSRLWTSFSSNSFVYAQMENTRFPPQPSTIVRYMPDVWCRRSRGVLMPHRLLTLAAPSVVSCWSEYSSAREKQCDILSCVLEKVVVYVIRFSVIKCMEHCRCWLQSVFANYIIRSKTPTLYGMHYTSTVTPALTSLARLLSTLIFNVISVKAKQG